jgi:hypothetical protein
MLNNLESKSSSKKFKIWKTSGYDQMPKSYPAIASKFLIFFLSGLLLFQSFPGLILAQEGGVDSGETAGTNPKSRQRTVTATVPNNNPPSTPILVAPSNNSYTTDNTPSFIWEESTDDNGMDHYKLTLDGATLFDSIPLTSTSNSEYTLVYDSVNDEYTLVPADSLSDGSHTWKITAFDVTGNITDSATWTFTIDTQAPSFVISQIGTANVSISAQDVSTIPLTPVILTENEPLIVATGEANSTVQVTLIIPGDPSQNYTVAIAADGTWSLQLGILPRDVVMTLNFVITDVAGNISVLSGVEFMIPEDEVTLPPGSPSPTPEGTPLPPGVVLPTPTPSPGVIAIPTTPLREVTVNAIQELIENVPFIQNFVDSLPETFKQVAEDLAPFSAVVVATALPAASLFAIISQFGANISPDLILKVLQALGLIPVGKPQGFVFNSESDEGVAFAVLTVTSVQGSEIQLNETVVTDMFGVYKGVNLPAGSYQIQVGHPEYRFPTSHPRPTHLGMAEFYRGEVFNTDGQHQTLFLIPVDPLESGKSASFKTRFRLIFARIARQSIYVLFPMFLISGILAIIFPTIWNWAIFGLYCVMLGMRVINWFKTPIVTGVIMNEQGEPQANAIVRLTEVESNELSAVQLTDKNGWFRFFGKKGVYQLSLNKQGYIWAPNGSPLSLFEVDVREKPYHLVATLSSLDKMYSELFGAVKA